MNKRNKKINDVKIPPVGGFIMKELNELFRKRIGFPKNQTITFDTLDQILTLTAASFPFENLCIFSNQIQNITEESLIKKLLKRSKGGLCYELNSLFFLFLKENSFDVTLVPGIVYDHHAEDWSAIGKTHVCILLKHQGNEYLIDTGFGGNLPLKPVSLKGTRIESANGEFQIKKRNGADEEYVLHMKLKYKHSEWKQGYTFFPASPIKKLSDLDAIQRKIVESTDSPFNKVPLLTKLTADGSITLTPSSLTVWNKGEMTKKEIEGIVFKDLAIKHFQLNVRLK
jgi:N-hydroxyarylamine O-acetyltransferase